MSTTMKINAAIRAAFVAVSNAHDTLDARITRAFRVMEDSGTSHREVVASTVSALVENVDAIEWAQPILAPKGPSGKLALLRLNQSGALASVRGWGPSSLHNPLTKSPSTGAVSTLIRGEHLGEQVVKEAIDAALKEAAKAPRPSQEAAYFAAALKEAIDAATRAVGERKAAKRTTAQVVAPLKGSFKRLTHDQRKALVDWIKAEYSDLI